MGMKDRPICDLCEEKEALMTFRGKWLCGECLMDWNKEENERMFNDMKKIREEKKRIEGPIVEGAIMEVRRE